MIIMAPISIGELLDKITILTIKMEKITDVEKLKNVINEHRVLKEISDRLVPTIGLDKLYHELLLVNRELWHIEENKRNHEKLKIFDEKFIELSRSVYRYNDYRAKLKKDINLLSGSTIIEEKSY